MIRAWSQPIKESLARFDSVPFNLVGARILQVVAGVVILYRIATELPVAQFLYGPHGIASGGSALEMFGPWLGGVINYLFATPWGIYVIMGIWGLGAAGLIAGIWPRVSALLALCGYLFMEPFSIVNDGGDNVLRLSLLYMVFFHPAVVNRKAVIKPGWPVFLHNVAVAAVTVQLVLLYWIAGSFKLGGEVWKNGTATYVVGQVQAYAPLFDWILVLLKSPILVTLTSYAAIVYLVGFPFMLANRFHLAWVVLGIGFHAGIAVGMGLWTFSAIMVGLILFCIRDREWRAIGEFLDRNFPRATVWIDGFCPYCRAAGKLIEKTDWLHRIEVRSFRHDTGYHEAGISIAELEKEMAVISQLRGQTEVHLGYRAVLMVLKLVPLGFFVYPFALLLEAIGLGPKAYRYLAENRKIIPDPKACADNCQLEEQ